MQTFTTASLKLNRQVDEIRIVVKEAKDALIFALKRIIKTTEVPAANPVQRGNYRDHSLFAAVEYAKLVLEGLEQ